MVLHLDSLPDDHVVAVDTLYENTALDQSLKIVKVEDSNASAYYRLVTAADRVGASYGRSHDASSIKQYLGQQLTLVAFDSEENTKIYSLYDSHGGREASTYFKPRRCDRNGRALPLDGDIVYAEWVDFTGLWPAQLIDVKWSEDENALKYAVSYLTHDDGTVLDAEIQKHADDLDREHFYLWDEVCPDLLERATRVAYKNDAIYPLSERDIGELVEFAKDSSADLAVLTRTLELIKTHFNVEEGAERAFSRAVEASSATPVGASTSRFTTPATGNDRNDSALGKRPGPNSEAPAGGRNVRRSLG